MRSIICLLLCLHLAYGGLNLTARNIQFVKRYNDQAWSTMTANLLHPDASVILQTNQIPSVTYTGASAITGVQLLYSKYSNMTQIYGCVGNCALVDQDYSCVCTSVFKNGANLRWFETIRTEFLCNGTELNRYTKIWVTEL